MKQVVVGLIVFILFILILNRFSSPESEEPIVINLEPVTLTQLSCEAVGGVWDTCGSACRGNEKDVCIDLCIEYCLCESDTQCPGGYVCNDYIDGQGTCQ